MSEKDANFPFKIEGLKKEFAPVIAEKAKPFVEELADNALKLTLAWIDELYRHHYPDEVKEMFLDFYDRNRGAINIAKSLINREYDVHYFGFGINTQFDNPVKIFSKGMDLKEVHFDVWIGTDGGAYVIMSDPYNSYFRKDYRVSGEALKVLKIVRDVYTVADILMKGMFDRIMSMRSMLVQREPQEELYVSGENSNLREYM